MTLLWKGEKCHENVKLNQIELKIISSLYMYGMLFLYYNNITVMKLYKCEKYEKHDIAFFSDFQSAFLTITHGEKCGRFFYILCCSFGK